MANFNYWYAITFPNKNGITNEGDSWLLTVLYSLYRIEIYIDSYMKYFYSVEMTASKQSHERSATTMDAATTTALKSYEAKFRHRPPDWVSSMVDMIYNNMHVWLRVMRCKESNINNCMSFWKIFCFSKNPWILRIESRTFYELVRYLKKLC